MEHFLNNVEKVDPIKLRELEDSCSLDGDFIAENYTVFSAEELAELLSVPINVIEMRALYAGHVLYYKDHTRCTTCRKFIPVGYSSCPCGNTGKLEWKAVPNKEDNPKIISKGNFFNNHLRAYNRYIAGNRDIFICPLCLMPISLNGMRVHAKQSHNDTFLNFVETHNIENIFKRYNGVRISFSEYKEIIRGLDEDKILINLLDCVKSSKDFVYPVSPTLLKVIDIKTPEETLPLEDNGELKKHKSRISNSYNRYKFLQSSGKVTLEGYRRCPICGIPQNIDGEVQNLIEHIRVHHNCTQLSDLYKSYPTQFKSLLAPYNGKFLGITSHLKLFPVKDPNTVYKEFEAKILGTVETNNTCLEEDTLVTPDETDSILNTDISIKEILRGVSTTLTGNTSTDVTRCRESISKIKDASHILWYNLQKKSNDYGYSSLLHILHLFAKNSNNNFTRYLDGKRDMFLCPLCLIPLSVAGFGRHAETHGKAFVDCVRKTSLSVIAEPFICKTSIDDYLQKLLDNPSVEDVIKLINSKLSGEPQNNKPILENMKSDRVETVKEEPNIKPKIFETEIVEVLDNSYLKTIQNRSKSLMSQIVIIEKQLNFLSSTLTNLTEEQELLEKLLSIINPKVENT
jgi:hypothetical protein